MAKHSSIVGGSNAGRLLNCPASHQAILALPPSADAPSEYAEEGTAMHAVMDAILRRRQSNVLMPYEMHLAAKSMLGRTFHDRVFTQEHYDTMVGPALDHLIALEREYGAGGAFFVAGVETRVKFPRLAGAFGTIDLVLQSDTCVLHVDWKFGQGVGVAMVYPADGGTIVNPQIMFYIAAAKASHPRWYANSRYIVGAIVQPRGPQPLTHTQITRAEIRAFVDDVENAVLLAIGRNPPRARGEHCRWAPCKVACPLWTGPLLDLSALEGDTVPPERPQQGATVTPYGAYLAKAKFLVDSLVMFKADIDRQMHSFLAEGGVIPGWRLKAKAKQRQWVDEQTVHKELRGLGLAEPEIWQTKLQTFQVVDAAAKRRGVEIPDHLRVAPPTTETTIATTSDPAPVVEPHLAIAQFREALKALPGDVPAARLTR